MVAHPAYQSASLVDSGGTVDSGLARIHMVCIIHVFMLILGHNMCVMNTLLIFNHCLHFTLLSHVTLSNLKHKINFSSTEESTRNNISCVNSLISKFMSALHNYDLDLINVNILIDLDVVVV